MILIQLQSNNKRGLFDTPFINETTCFSCLNSDCSYVYDCMNDSCVPIPTLIGFRLEHTTDSCNIFLCALYALSNTPTGAVHCARTYTGLC